MGQMSPLWRLLYITRSCRKEPTNGSPDAPWFLGLHACPCVRLTLWSPSPGPRAQTRVWALGADQAETAASGLKPRANFRGPATNNSAK